MNTALLMPNGTSVLFQTISINPRLPFQDEEKEKWICSTIHYHSLSDAEAEEKDNVKDKVQKLIASWDKYERHYYLLRGQNPRLFVFGETRYAVGITVLDSKTLMVVMDKSVENLFAFFEIHGFVFEGRITFLPCFML